MTKSALLVLLLLFFLSACDGGGNLLRAQRWSEHDYSSAWCRERGGEVDATLSDGSRPDCVLAEHAVEFDFGEGSKPYECAGQARHYAKLTGKRPLCVLIWRKGVSAAVFRRAASRVDAPVQCMDSSGEMISCK